MRESRRTNPAAQSILQGDKLYVDHKSETIMMIIMMTTSVLRCYVWSDLQAKVVEHSLVLPHVPPLCPSPSVPPRWTSREKRWPPPSAPPLLPPGCPSLSHPAPARRGGGGEGLEDGRDEGHEDPATGRDGPAAAGETRGSLARSHVVNNRFEYSLYYQLIDSL